MRRFPVPNIIRSFASRFRDAGFSLYIVGGAIRDYLLGIPNDDYDFTTDAAPDEVRRLFSRVIPTGIVHGTVTVLFSGQKFEVTTFRSDGTYFDGRHPDSVKFIRNLAEDLNRRDFTINAFAADCFDGTITDLHNGLSDLRSGTVRAIGDPRLRFGEDALRMMRACRIVAKLDFSIEEDTYEAMRELHGSINRVSAERIRVELFKLVLSDHPRRGLEYLQTSGILAVLFPSLAKGEGILQGGMHREDILQHNISACQAAANHGHPLEVRLAALFHDIGKSFVIEPGEGRNTFHGHEIVGAEEARKIMTSLKASNEQIRTVSHLVREHMFHYTEDWTDSAVRRFINRVGLPYLPFLFQLRIDDQEAIHGCVDIRGIDSLQKRIDAILKARDALSVRDLAVNGNDLMAAGIPQGKRIGATLSFLLETVIEDPAQNTKDRLLKIALLYQASLGPTKLS